MSPFSFQGLSHKFWRNLPKLSFFLFFLSGCATLTFQRTEVRFEDPALRLGVVKLEPTEVEKQGILLRLLPPKENFARYEEETLIFQLIKEGRGLKTEFKTRREERFSAGTRPDTYRLRSETTFHGIPGRILEAVEQSEQGEILRLIEGFHKSKIGKFKIESWSRTPVFPSSPVKIGDKWNYDEVLDVRLESFWVKEKRPEPFIVKATSTLTGFALVQGRRCAVIETRAFQRKQERLKSFFKEITLEIHSNIQETTYLDYAQGRVQARVTRTESYAFNPETGLENRGQSQSIFSSLP